jgi:hypothetical protein
MDKTTIENNDFDIYNIDIIEGKITAIAGYYDILLVQPDINTIPALNIVYTNVCKDVNNNMLFIKPLSITNIIGNTNLNLNSRSKMTLMLEDSTSEVLSLSIYGYDYIDKVYKIIATITNNMEIMLDCGMYKFISNSNILSYDIIYFKG